MDDSLDACAWALEAGPGLRQTGAQGDPAEARVLGLEYVEMTTDPENVASQKVMLANGAVLVERFRRPAQCGSKDGFRFRIFL